MDRFIEVVDKVKLSKWVILKSNMDRFIVSIFMNLSHTKKVFKIQYG